MPLHRKRRATQQSVKSDPPALRVAQSSPLDIVACLRVAPLRVCAALLASGELWAILMPQSTPERL
jgi:hypothetical protein